MFVPCDEDGNILKEPIETIGGVEYYSIKYNKAKEKVLFDGISHPENTDLNLKKIVGNNILILFFSDGRIYFNSKEVKTIEDLTPYKLKLKICHNQSM